MAPPRIPSIEDEVEAMAMAKAIGAAEPPTASARQMIMMRASVKAHTLGREENVGDGQLVVRALERVVERPPEVVLELTREHENYDVFLDW